MATPWFISRRLGRRIPTWASACPFIHIVLGFSVALIVLMTMIPAQAQTTPDPATYTVTFQGNWTLDSTPGGVVGSAHFTTLVGAVHNDMVTFWESGGMATSGVEGVAELGSTGTFASEVTAAGGNASLVRETIRSSPTVTATFEIEVTSDHPLFTLLSMIGPSPDWFVGVSGLSLLDGQGQWLSEREVDLFPYDAGTEDGEEFRLSNDATNPHGTITSIKGMGKFSDEPMAMLSFELQTASTVAGAPQNLQAVAGSAELTLSWDAPDDDGGADITDYAYRYKESGGDFSDYMDIPDSGPGEANARSYTVTGLMNEQEYVFQVHAVNEHGGGAPAEVTVMLPAVVNTESEELPTEVTLSGNYPNPFNPETTIRYGLPKAGEVRLAVYNLLGHEVAILVDRSKSAGNHTVRFGAGNLPSGVYVYRLHAGDETIVRTMMLVK